MWILAGLWLSPLVTSALDPRLEAVNDWLYLLQHPVGSGPAEIAASDFDLVVMDYSADGSEPGEFLRSEIEAIKDSGKIALAYVSIGEAEIQRFYWDPNWIDQGAADPDAPAWLGPFNPDFPDNYKVRYWDAEWQAILFGIPTGPSKSYLDRVIDQGFDGVYLDIIDAFIFWSEEASPGDRVTRAQARTDMIALVQGIADYARTTRGVTDFLVFPQNGAEIIADGVGQLDAMGTSYLGSVSGIGAEDTFYNELAPQSPTDRAFITGLLDTFVSGAGGTRMVLAVDYVLALPDPASGPNIARSDDFHSLAIGRGYTPYSAALDRDLDEIVVLTAEEGFVHAQPKVSESLASGWALYR